MRGPALLAFGYRLGKGWVRGCFLDASFSDLLCGELPRRRIAKIVNRIPPNPAQFLSINYLIKTVELDSVELAWINAEAAEFSAIRGRSSVKQCVLTFVILTAATLPSFALAAEGAAGNSAPVQMSDMEMDNVTAAGNAFGRETAPGQLRKLSGLKEVAGGGKAFAPGQLKKLSAGAKIQGGGKVFAPGQIRKGL